MSKATIRYAKENDYEVVEAIMEQVQSLHVGWRPDIYKKCDCVLAYDEFSREAEQETMLIAESGGQVAGLLSFMVRHIENDHQVTRDVLFIDAIAVHERYRGNGIGHQLLDTLQEIKAERKLDGIELQVNARNIAAKQMYEKYGFTEKSINMEL